MITKRPEIMYHNLTITQVNKPTTADLVHVLVILTRDTLKEILFCVCDTIASPNRNARWDNHSFTAKRHQPAYVRPAA